MLSKLTLLASAALVAAAPLHEDAGMTHTPVKARASMTNPDGTVNGIALVKSLQRTVNKYHKGSDRAELKQYFERVLEKHDNEKRAGHTISLVDQVEAQEDELYYGLVTVGTSSPQTFTVDFDTGSADFFVPGPSCGTSQGCVGSTKYSQKGTDEHNTTSVTYGSGSVSGENYFDTVTVAGYSSPHTNVVSLTTASGFSSSDSEGLMGLAFQSIANSGQPTFVENLIAQGQLANKEFSFYLGRDKSGTQNNSVLTIGGTDSSKYTGAFTTVPVSSQTYWQVAVDATYVSGKSAGATTKGQAAIDTGTTIILAPTAAATSIYTQIPGAFPVPLISGSPTLTLFAYPCNTKATVSIGFAGKQFQINPLDFNFGTLTSNLASLLGSDVLLKFLNTDAASATQYCIGAVGGDDIDPTENLYVVGDSFIKNWYATFDFVGSNGQPSVNFAKSV